LPGLLIEEIHPAQGFQDEPTLLREVAQKLHELAAAVGQTVGQHDLGPRAQLRGRPRRAVTHQHRRRQLGGSSSQDLQDVLAGMVRPGEEEGDGVALGIGRDHTGGEHTRAGVSLRAGHLQHLHAGIVAMKDISLGALPDEFLLGRLEQLGPVFHQLPLGGRRQGDPVTLLDGLKPIEGDPVAVLGGRNRADRGLVILVRADPWRCGRCEDLAAEVAAQALELIHGGADRGTADEADQRTGILLEVDLPLGAVRAMASRLHFLVRNLDPFGAGKGLGPIPAMSGSWRTLLPGSRGAARRRVQQPGALLAGAPGSQAGRHRVQRIPKGPAFLVIEHLLARRVDDPVELVEVDVDPATPLVWFHPGDFGAHTRNHASSPENLDKFS